MKEFRLEDIQKAAICFNQAYRKAQRDGNYAALNKHFRPLNNNNDIDEIIPFYKNDKKAGLPAGYVIRTKDSVTVSYRGTDFSNMSEINNDLKMHHSEMKLGNGASVQVHTGFLREFESSSLQLDSILANMNKENLPLRFTGHSLGGAIATLAAFAL